VAGNYFDLLFSNSRHWW